MDRMAFPGRNGEFATFPGWKTYITRDAQMKRGVEFVCEACGETATSSLVTEPVEELHFSCGCEGGPTNSCSQYIFDQMVEEAKAVMFSPET